ncbi:hypothetical protein TI03_01080 [Achromatium sp. WMS1]|nr:hypothetical protein TI03_01080 [Achromatium sp. WMS1]
MFINLSLTLVMLVVLWSGDGLALSLGDMITKSALNERFNAEIEIKSSNIKEVERLRVSLASAAAFAKAGVDRPFLLTRIRFRVVEKARGKYVIKLTSRAPIREPYLDFLIELNWPSGRVLRQFTTLLDPASQARLPTVTMPDPEIQRPNIRPVSVKTIPVYGPIPRGTTISKIAQTIKADGVRTNQVIQVLFKNNPHAFFSQ